jgi:hypothetical protein
MKSAFLAAALLALAATAANAQSYGYETGSYPSQHYGSGYTRSHRSYVAPYRAPNPTPKQYYNYGTGGSYNSYPNQYGSGTSAY